ncbi:MAG: hypothetical protein HC905_05265 [Bacteroidales bacterium]|nr:hypothetical protein [Bacteroidales bacterium]
MVNEFNTMLTEGGDYSTCLSKPRRHILSSHQAGIHSKIEDWHLPVSLKPEETVNFKIYTGPVNKKNEYVIRIILDNLKGFDTADFTVTLNNESTNQIADMSRDPDYVYDSYSSKKVEHVSELGGKGTSI